MKVRRDHRSRLRRLVLHTVNIKASVHGVCKYTIVYSVCTVCTESLLARVLAVAVCAREREKLSLRVSLRVCVCVCV